MSSRSLSGSYSHSITSGRSSNGMYRNPHSWSPQTLASSRNSISRLSSGTVGSRPLTGDHMLDWCIPRHIAVTAGKRPNTNCSTTRSQVGNQESDPDNDDSPTEEGDNKPVPSPLHNDSKQEWTTRYADDRIRSLPIPPPYKPKIYNYPASHADNLAELFGKALAENNCVFYSRYGIPMVPLAMLSPNYQVPWADQHMWKSNASYNSYVPPPPQSMFLNAGAPPRRHFSVAPDWRRIRH